MFKSYWLIGKAGSPQGYVLLDGRLRTEEEVQETMDHMEYTWRLELPGTRVYVKEE